MSQQERQRERQKERQGKQNKKQSSDQGEQYRERTGRVHSPDQRRISSEKETKKQKPKIESFTVEEPVAGSNGETNIEIDWVQMPLPEQNAMSAFFKITTASGNGLSAEMVQASYKKDFKGTTTLETSYVPVAADGTKGYMEVSDTTTGETRKVTWRWRWTKGVSFWQLLKDLVGAITSSFKR